MLTIDLDKADIGAGMRVLDLGCGGGRHAYACLKNGAEVIALDLDPVEVAGVRDMVGALREAGEVGDGTRSAHAVANALALPFSDESFDAVIASEILEHVREDYLVIEELARVLRRGGRLAVSVPRAWPEALNWVLSSEYHRVEGGHVRIYRRRQLRARLAWFGFSLEASHHAHGLHAPYWWLRCLVGVGRDHQRLVAAYHRFLVFDIMRQPRWTRLIETVLNPVMGKSLVLYLVRDR